MKISKHVVLRSISVVALASLIGLTPLLQTSAESYGTTEVASIANDSSLPNNATDESIVSPDGRYVYFESAASNLVTNDTNNAYDIFVRDRMTGTTTLLDANNSGIEANNGVEQASSFGVSDGGRYLAFISISTNLVSSEYNSNDAIFVRDLKTGVTSLVYQNSFTGQNVSGAYISGNGDWIVFKTQQPLAPYNDNSTSVYVINRSTLALTRISNGLNGAVANAWSGDAQINYDGSSVVFDSLATNLVSNDTNGHQDVFLWQKSSSSLSRVDVSSSGIQANADSMYPYISGDGKKIAFSSSATNLVSTPTTYGNAYLYTVDSGTTTLESTTPSGSQGNGGSGADGISEDGHDILFDSGATDLVPNDNFNNRSMFVKNLDDNSTTIVSYDNNGNQVQEQGFGFISADGQYVTFAANMPSVSRVAYLRY